MWLVGIAGGVVLLYLVWTFNRLVSLKNRANAAWSDIDVQLKLRWDLVPSLVATVEGYTKHEAETLQKVVGARQQAMHCPALKRRGWWVVRRRIFRRRVLRGWIRWRWWRRVVERVVGVEA